MSLRAAAIALVVHLNAADALAQAADTPAPDVRLDTPSGFPVPRFVSLKAAETNCRIGPSFEHPIRFRYVRAEAPVLVIAESRDHWRKIIDSEGDDCWVHETTLKAQTHVLIVNVADLRRRPAKDAGVSGRLGDGVLARLIKRKDDWLLVSAGAARGWIEAREVWGGGLAASVRRN